MVRRSIVAAALTLASASAFAAGAPSASAAITAWPVTSGGSVSDSPSAVAAGSGGRVWYATQRTLDVGSAYGLASTTLSGRVRFYKAPAASSIGPLPGGVVYATEDGIADSHRLIRLSGGTVSTLPLPTPGAEASSMIAGPDGNGWFVETSQDFSVNAVGRVTPAGQISEFPLPDVTETDPTDGTTITVPAGPVQIVAGPSRTLWVAVTFGVDELNTQGQVIRTLSYPETDGYAGGLAVGTDGTAWVATDQSYAVEISPNGAVSTPAMPYGMTADNAGVGPGGVVYLTSAGGAYSGLWQADGPGGPRAIRFTVNVPGLGPRATVSANGMQAISPGPAGTLWLAATLMDVGSIEGLVTVDLGGRCIVPKLYVNRSFSYGIGQARALLKAHGCGLGHVDYHSRASPEVICQRLAPGSVRRHGARVAIGVAALIDVIPRSDFTRC